MNTKKHLKAICLSAATIISILLSILISGCSNNNTLTATDDEVNTAIQSSVSTSDEATAVNALAQLGINADSLGIHPNINYDVNNMLGFQLDMPNDGETVAVIKTSEGDITLRFFPEQAPKTVTNFINLAESGKYNNTTFHKVINDTLIQGGHIGDDENDPNGTSYYGDEFEDEFCDKLLNLRGAVSMANTSADTNGSQFFINQTNADSFKNNGGFAKYENIWENAKAQLVNYKDSSLLSAFIDENADKCYNTDIVDTNIRKLYESNGGNPNFDGAYNAVDRGNTVFAQVIDGMNVVDKIAQAEVDSDNKPVKNIVIESIQIKAYTQTASSASKTESNTKSK